MEKTDVEEKRGRKRKGEGGREVEEEKETQGGGRKERLGTGKG